MSKYAIEVTINDKDRNLKKVRQIVSKQNSFSDDDLDF